MIRWFTALVCLGWGLTVGLLSVFIDERVTWRADRAACAELRLDVAETTLRLGRLRRSLEGK